MVTGTAAVPTVVLDDGVEISQLGFAIFRVPPAETAEAVATALDLGERTGSTPDAFGSR